MPGVTAERRFGSVTYGHVDKLGGETIDLAVVWRLPWWIDEFETSAFHARQTYLWLHDFVPAELSLNSHIAIAKSSFHRSICEIIFTTYRTTESC